MRGGERGQTAVEYGLAFSLAAVALIGVMLLLGMDAGDLANWLQVELEKLRD